MSAVALRGRVTSRRSCVFGGENRSMRLRALWSRSIAIRRPDCRHFINSIAVGISKHIVYKPQFADRNRALPSANNSLHFYGTLHI